MIKRFTWNIGLFNLLVLFTILLAGPRQTYAGENDTVTVSAMESQTASAPKEKESFNAGELIMEHVVDNHEWHIAGIGEKHIIVPLPVILFYDGSLYTFWSSAFHNPTHSYKGFVLQQEGPQKGKIIREDLAGITGPKVYDFSITKTVLALFFSVALMLVIFLSVAKGYRKNRGEAPSGVQSLFEPIILFVRDDIAKSSIGEKRYEKFMPYLLTIFFFIFLNNLLGMIPIFPGGANVTGNIAVTMVMAVFTFFITSFTGTKHYWIDIVNTPGVPWWLKFPLPLMPIVEIIGIITKPFVLMIRLFANITAGHIIQLGFVCLIFIFGAIGVGFGYGVSVVSVAFMLFMSLIELLVAFIQAYVFTLLSALYFGLAMVEPEKHEHE